MIWELVGLISGEVGVEIIIKVDMVMVMVIVTV